MEYAILYIVGTMAVIIMVLAYLVYAEVMHWLQTHHLRKNPVRRPKGGKP